MTQGNTACGAKDAAPPDGNEPAKQVLTDMRYVDYALDPRRDHLVSSVGHRLAIEQRPQFCGPTAGARPAPWLREQFGHRDRGPSQVDVER
jgi:hypothetical protein